MSKPEQSKSVVIQYYVLRSLIGLAGFCLPFAVWLGSKVLDDQGLLGSISTYYYSSTRDVFVGMLVFTGVFLVTYQGYRGKSERLWGRLSDNLLTNIAGAAALGVALFPTAACDTIRCTTQFPAAPWTAAAAVHVIHVGSAAVFLLALGIMAAFSFTKSGRDTPEAKLRYRTYIVTGTVILTSAVAIGVYGLLPDSFTSRLDHLNPIFWGEALGISAFGVAWLTKGRALRTGLNVLQRKPVHTERGAAA